MKSYIRPISYLFALPLLLGGCSLGSDGGNASEPQKRIKSVHLYYCDEAGVPKAEAKKSWTILYDAGGDISEVLKGYREDDVSPVSFTRELLSWSEGRVSRLESYYQKDSRWELDTRRCFSYDGTGRLVKRTEFKPSRLPGRTGEYYEGFSWEYRKAPEVSVKRTYGISTVSDFVTYPRPGDDKHYRLGFDEKTREILRIGYKKDVETGNLQPSGKTETRWCAWGVSSIDKFDWKDGHWVRNERIEYRYDEYGFILNGEGGSEYRFQREGEKFTKVLLCRGNKVLAVYMVGYETGTVSEAGRRYFRGGVNELNSPFYSS